jgi:hypothetical protein
MDDFEMASSGTAVSSNEHVACTAGMWQLYYESIITFCPWTLRLMLDEIGSESLIHVWSFVTINLR